MIQKEPQFIKEQKHFTFIFLCYVDSPEKRKMKERGRRGGKSKRKREGRGGRERAVEGREGRRKKRAINSFLNFSQG